MSKRVKLTNLTKRYYTIPSELAGVGNEDYIKNKGLKKSNANYDIQLGSVITNEQNRIVTNFFEKTNLNPGGTIYVLKEVLDKYRENEDHPITRLINGGKFYVSISEKESYELEVRKACGKLEKTEPLPIPEDFYNDPLNQQVSKEDMFDKLCKKNSKASKESTTKRRSKISEAETSNQEIGEIIKAVQNFRQ